MRILLQIPLSSYIGYGRDGIGLTQALIRAGADVYLDPPTVQAPLPPEVAALLTKQVAGEFDLTISHLEPGTLHAKQSTKAVSGTYIAWTMWEWSNLSNLRGRSTLRKRLKEFDAVLGYDANSSEGLRPYYSGPVVTLQGGYSPEDWPEVERDWYEENFYFCMVGMLHDRKNPWAAIQAFNELRMEHEDFAAHARLSLKTLVPGVTSQIEQAIPGIRVYYESWDDATLRSFYEAQHVLLAPSRGEGKNMPALEFMSTGGTVIATDWGGHQQWLNPDYAYPLRYELTARDPKHPEALSAAVDIEHLKEQMLRVFRNRTEARLKGNRAAQVIPAMASWDKVVDRLFLRLKTAGVRNADRLWSKSQTMRWESSDASDR